MAGGEAHAHRLIDRPSTIVMLILACTIGDSVFMVLPFLVDALTQVLQLSVAQTGLLASADLAGIAIATASGPFWLRRAPWRPVLLAALVAFTGANGLCLGLVHFPQLLALRLVAGLAAGLVLTIGLGALTDTTHVARNSALMICAQTFYGAIALFVLPLAQDAARLDAVFVFLILTTVPALALCWRFFPSRASDRVMPANGPPLRLSAGAAFVVLATFIFYLMTGATWAYFGEIGQEAGLSLAEANDALSASLIVSLAGSFAAAWLALRIGRAVPLVAAAAVQVVTLYVYSRIGLAAHPLALFYAVNCVYLIAWSFVISYIIVLFDDVDASGRLVSFYGTAMHVGLCVGPAAGSLVIVGRQHATILVHAIVCVLVAYVLLLTTVRIAGNRVPRGERS